MMGSLFHALKENRAGSASTEFALVLPVFLTAFIGILETSNYFFIAATLENAVLHASRFGVIGDTGTHATREDAILDVIETQTFGRIDVPSLTIETLVYDNFGDIGDSEPYSDINENNTYDEGEPFSDVNGNGVWDDDVAVAGLGGSGDIVLYRISHEPQSLTGLFDSFVSQLPLSATMAVRNEPF